MIRNFNRFGFRLSVHHAIPIQTGVTHSLTTGGKNNFENNFPSFPLSSSTASRLQRNIQSNNIAFKRFQSTKQTSKPVSAIERLYQRKSPIEHVLIRPDTYVGSTELQSSQMWITNNFNKMINNNNTKVSSANVKFVFENVEFVPALYKIVDEILVNAVSLFFSLKS